MLNNYTKLNIKEVLETSIKLEEQSVLLYEKLAGQVKNEGIKNAFLVLCEEEKKHVDIFNEKSGQVTYELALEHDGEHIDMLLEYFKMKILPREKLKEKIQGLRGLESIFQFAIDLELEHIMFYTEIKSFVRKEDEGYLEEIIDEERRHFLRLMQLKKAL